MSDYPVPFEVKRLLAWAKAPDEPSFPEKSSIEDVFRFSPPGVKQGQLSEDRIHDDQIGAASTVWFERLSFILEELSPNPALEPFCEALRKRDRVLLAKEAKTFRAYLETHPAVGLEHPFLEYIAALPVVRWGEIPGTYWNVKSGANWHVKFEKVAGALPETTDNYYDKTPHTAKFDVLIGLGFLSPTSLRKGYVEKERSPQELISLLRVYRAAEAMHGKAWQKNCREERDRVRDLLADVEWKYDNQLLAGDGPDHMRRIARLSPLIAPLAFDGESQGISWRYLVKQLWEDEADLKQRFSAVPYHPNDSTDKLSPDDSSFFVDDPRFGLALFEIGSRLHAFDQNSLGTNVPTPEKIRELGRQAVKDWGVPGIWDQKNELHQIYLREIRRIQWEDVERFRAALERSFEAPDGLEKVSKMLPGPYRDIFIYAAWKGDREGVRHPARWYLEHLNERVPDSARANRAPDLMNRYVRDHYMQGTREDNTFQKEVAAVLARFEALGINREGVDAVKEYRGMGYGLPKMWDSYFKQGSIPQMLAVSRLHEARKRDMQEKWKTAYTPAVNDLYLFSGTVAKSQQSSTLAEIAYRPQVVAEIGARMLQSTLDDLQRGTLNYERAADAIEGLVMRWIPERCQLRDFFLENALHLRLWAFLQHSSIRGDLDALGVRFAEHPIDLNRHFAGRDEGVLSGAYMTTYVLFRVEGIAPHIRALNEVEQGELSERLRGLARISSAETAEKYERMAIDVEYPLLRKRYYELVQDTLPKDRSASPEEERAAYARAFDATLARIKESFQYASYYRDGLLESVALDMARTPDEARRVESMTYAFLMRNPVAEKKQGEKVAFSPVETVRNYLAAFQDRGARSRILGWIFGGELPDDRFLEGKTFGVNADAEREAFWMMSDEERKTVLYHALIGEHGLFDCTTEPKSSQRYNQNFTEMERFLDVLYTCTFEPILKKDQKNPQTERALRSIFQETFFAYSPARRVELLCGMTKKIGEMRRQKQELTSGQAIRLFLEQVGVVGIKAGQVFSEHEELVPEQIRPDLSSLRDRATPFAKFGMFAYVRMAKLFPESPGTAPIRISEVGECVGSASIKQVHEAVTTTGEMVVVKAPRPTIEKNFEEDVRVLTRVMVRLRSEGFEIPEFLLPEIVDACRSEFDFGKDVDAQKDLGHIFKQRRASVVMEDKRIPMATPDVLYVVRKGEAGIKNLQLIVEEHARGLSLVDVEAYQRVREGDDVGSMKQRVEIEARVERLYGSKAPRILHAYRFVDTTQLRAQIALDLIQQITEDGLFQADAHSGNIVLDLNPNHERLEWIDFGSVGHSLESVDGPGQRDHRPAFRQFLQSLLTLSLDMGDARGMGEVVASYVDQSDMTAEDWATRIGEIRAAHPDMSHFFKELTSAILSGKGKIDRTFKLFLKGLAAGGGHFDALSRVLPAAVQEAMTKSARESRPLVDVLSEYPGFEKLLPLLQNHPQLRVLLGTSSA